MAVTPAAPAAPVAIRPAHAPSDSGRDIVIAIDAGHGGVDPGASGKRGTREKDVVLEIAKALAARINAEPGMKAVLTRDGDYFISLQRTHAARAPRQGGPVRVDPCRRHRQSRTCRVRRCTCCPIAAPRARPRAGWPSVKTRPT